MSSSHIRKHGSDATKDSSNINNHQSRHNCIEQYPPSPLYPSYTHHPPPPRNTQYILHIHTHPYPHTCSSESLLPVSIPLPIPLPIPMSETDVPCPTDELSPSSGSWAPHREGWEGKAERRVEKRLSVRPLMSCGRVGWGGVCVRGEESGARRGQR